MARVTVLTLATARPVTGLMRVTDRQQAPGPAQKVPLAAAPPDATAPWAISSPEKWPMRRLREAGIVLAAAQRRVAEEAQAVLLPAVAVAVAHALAEVAAVVAQGWVAEEGVVVAAEEAEVVDAPTSTPSTI